MSAGDDGAAPFDAVAAEYDSVFTRTTTGRWLRARVWERLELHLRAPMRVLELGCGTGEDALWLARRGVCVTATDASTAMLAVARDKLARAGLLEQVEFARLDLARLDGAPPRAAFDGALSNFGGLNCIEDLRPVAEFLGGALRPGGRAVLVVMGPWCPWEIVWYAGHLQPRQAWRRLRPGGVDAEVHGQRVHAWYPSPGLVRRAFAPWFRHLRTSAVGALLPPPYLGGLVDRWPGFFARVNALERRVAHVWPLSVLNDHYLLEMERAS